MNSHPKAAEAAPFDAIFAQGGINPYSRFFTGTSYLTMLSENDPVFNCPIGCVAFEPAARTNWHKHSGGQILLVLAGEGIFQVRGKAARVIKKGDVVRIAPNLEHWHGAAPHAWMTHLSIEPNMPGNRSEWLEPVTDADYGAANSGLCAPSSPEAAAPSTAADGLRQIYDRLTIREIPAAVKCSAEMQALILTASLTALNDRETLSMHLEKAIDAGVAPVKLREAIVQTMAYSGLAHAIEAQARLAAVLEKKGIRDEMPESGAVSDADRFYKGIAVQKSIFGSTAIDWMHQNAKPDEKFITVTQLSSWCFGDSYTRRNLTLPMRELLTFCTIVSMGGCGPQVKAHAEGNAAVGNGRAVLLDALAVMLPVIGFPKVLNALAAINAAAPAD